MTRQQAKSTTWFQQRAWRVTASAFSRAAKADIGQPSLSLVRQICYPKAFQFTTKATR
ncbi:hypothetical protein LSH36_197g00060 [Paralvinella palmiformis]|uniref:Uncharacterized protein n=1 Tax=Paralvinella palmiformis TaxID=53620 RepID=A0AAD9JPR0_9ANNE|nr:hypothetical protein LSH36_197g00060 [Paralvinella palmiformis]